ncbi:MAG: phosphatase PAP2 family protein [Anaerolineae bacterium]|nr:phosphatase PAP2 family protein [Anaerolineae bacterium]
MLSTFVRKIQEILNWRLFIVGLIAFICMYVFWELAENVWIMRTFSWDQPIMEWVHSWRSPLLTSIFLFITNTVGPLIFIPLALIFFDFWRHRFYYQIILVIFSILGFGAIVTVLKLIFQRPRPDVFDPIVTETSFSFPSGHTGAAVALFGLAGVFFWRQDNRIAAIVCWVWIFMVMLSRVYLGAHYPSDVLGSLVLGTIWVVLITVEPISRRKVKAENAAKA